MAEKLTYKDAGVDIETGDDISQRISSMAASTFGPDVLKSPGGFAGMFSLDGKHPLLSRKLRNPILVACADGVGTKLEIAERVGRHDTIGVDLVAMSVNDLACTGATPLFFLDYVASSRLSKDKLLEVMKGIVEGCRQAGCALLGGETAEMPGFYKGDLYDLAGFAVGIVERSEVMEAASVQPGDTVLGVASSGIHSNGYSLVRKVIKRQKADLNSYHKELGCTLGEELLKPTVVYSPAVRTMLEYYKVKNVIKGIAHITGGGLPGNIPRILPPSCSVELNSKKWKVHPIFRLLQEWGGIDGNEMYRVFNMGLGLVVIVAPYYAAAVAKRIRRAGFKAWLVGKVVEGAREVAVS